MDHTSLSTSNSSATVAPIISSANGGVMTDEVIFRAECARLCHNIDERVWDKLARKYLKPAIETKRKDGTIVRGYKKKDVLALAKRIEKVRKPGLPLIVKSK